MLSGGYLLLCALSYAEHTRSVKPSFILNTYLLGSLLFDVAHARTLWLRYEGTYNAIIAVVATVAAAAKLLLVVLEAVEKRSILKSEFSDYPSEATAGFYNRSFFWWLNPLFKIGFNHVLSVNDLFILDKELRSERLLALFEERWSKGTFFIPCKLDNADRFSEIEITQYLAIRVLEGYQMATSRRCSRKNMRRGIQFLSTITPPQVPFLLSGPNQQCHQQRRLRADRCIHSCLHRLGSKSDIGFIYCSFLISA